MTVIRHSEDYEAGALDALDYILDEREDLEDVTLRVAERIGADILAGHRHHRGAVKALERIAAVETSGYGSVSATRLGEVIGTARTALNHLRGQ